jgi:hypothetical protein
MLCSQFKSGSRIFNPPIHEGVVCNAQHHGRGSAAVQRKASRDVAEGLRRGFDQAKLDSEIWSKWCGSFQGRGRKTVDVQQIKERFKSLDIDVDWATFDKISKIRNNIEHYLVTESANAIKELVADSFLIIRDFVTKELGEQPVDLLGVATWNVLLETSAVLEKQRAECKATIEAIGWKAI